MSTPNLEEREEALLLSMIGLAITDVQPWGSDDGSGGGVAFSLSDGRTINVDGWGHDWWGINVYETEQP